MTAKAETVLYYDKYPATTIALKQVALNAQVTGYITAINFTEGTHVHKGQLLYKLDERLYQASVDQARANLRVDSGNLKQQQQDADRYVYLAKHNAVATQLVDHQLIALQNAKDSVVAAQQALKTALTNFTYSNIYAPFDGTIGISQVRIGNLVSPGTTLSTPFPPTTPWRWISISLKRSCHTSRTCKCISKRQSTRCSLFNCPTVRSIPSSGRSRSSIGL
jgi:membrane fusion protein (multidrug efflux system)